MRTLVARLDSVGDVLLSGAAVRAIAGGSDEVWMLCGPQGAPAAEMLPGVDHVVTWSAPWIIAPAPDFTRESARELLSIVERVSPDAAVILTSFHQSPLPLAALLRLAGVPRITGASIDYAGSLLDVRLKPGEDFPEDQPEAHRALRIAQAAGFAPADGDHLAVTGVPDVSGIVPEGRYTVVHPGATVPAREWPASHHESLVAELTARGRTVVVTGTPSETALTARVSGSTAIDLGGRTSLRELAGVLAGADAVVVGNTGPAHLAAAVGTPVVSLFSPVVSAERWAPWGVPTVILGDQDAACRGSRARECPIAGHPCLSVVQPSEVADACERLIVETEGALL
ncbi:ADP-heptose:LPS heptosyltransferase [Paramicrobacterium agarici]|nr:ADP-heptose:LPS heptosyltransferase [Microbacterium agarici]